MSAAWVALACLFLAQSATEVYRRAGALLEKRDLDGARAAVDEALRLDPKLVPALALKAKLAINDDRLEEAHRLLDTAIALAPRQRDLRFLLGMTLYLKNDFDPALRALAAADPIDARVSLYKAMTEEALNHSEAAISHYERALELDPKGVDQRVAFARLCFALGRLDRAEALADEALRLDPRSPAALYEKGRCLFEGAEFRSAAEAGERALAGPGSAPLERRIRHLLIRAYGKIGDAEAASRHQAVFDRLPNPLVR